MRRRQLEQDYEDEQRALRLVEAERLERERRERLERERWENMINDLKRYWDMHEEGDRNGMNWMILRFETHYEYGENFNRTYFGALNRDELVSAWGELDSDGEVNEDSVENMEYFGMELWKCQFCDENTNGEDILSERMSDNWMVPMCGQCVNSDNRPCGTCRQHECICEYMFNE